MNDTNLIHRITLAGLAAFGVAYTLAFLAGPFDLATRLRTWVLKRYGKDTWQDEGINCPICLSFWCAMPFQVWACWRNPGALIPAICATCGTTAMTHKLWKEDE